MYRYVHNSTNRSKALKLVRDAYVRNGYNVTVHKEHNCVDVFDKNNNIIYQVYPVEVEPKDRIRNNYVYVGKGNGNFIQVTRYGTEKRYNPYLTDIKKVDTVRRYVPTLP